MVRTVLLLWLLCLANVAEAQTLYRCTDEAGNAMYVDRPCEHFNAVAAPTVARDPALTDALATDASPPSSPLEPATPPPAAYGCPGPDPQRLRDSAIRAIAQRDINALTGMYHWPGAGSASSVVGRLQALIDAQPHRVLLEAPPPDDAWLWNGEPPPDTRNVLPELHAYRSEATGPAVATFRLVRYAGCVWLSR